MPEFPCKAFDIAQAKRTWQKDGCLVLRDVLDQKEVERLRLICEPIFQEWTRTSREETEPGGWWYGRPGGFLMIHLNHPARHTDVDNLKYILESFAMAPVLALLESIFGEPAVFMQGNLYHNPKEGAKKSWHRDCQFYPENNTDQAMRDAVKREAEPPRELHMHIPLIPTAASEVVPGSHNRFDTAQEYRIRTQDPTSDEMPGAKLLELQPGDLAFFHVNSLHRGIQDAMVPRRTIAITYGRGSAARPMTAESMKQTRGYGATFQPWCLSKGYTDDLSPTAAHFFQRFIDVYGSNWKADLVEEVEPPLRPFFAGAQ